MKRNNRLGQEEMIGFGLIIIIVAVILLIFLWFSLSKPSKQNVESYEVESFIGSFLQYTSGCENSRVGYLSVQDLIYYCYGQKECDDGRKSCDVLQELSQGIVDESWKIGEKSKIKGYLLNISVDGKEIVPALEKGNQTGNSKGYEEQLKKSQGSASIVFSAYY